MNCILFPLTRSRDRRALGEWLPDWRCGVELRFCPSEMWRDIEDPNSKKKGKKQQQQKRVSSRIRTHDLRSIISKNQKKCKTKEPECS